MYRNVFIINGIVHGALILLFRALHDKISFFSVFFFLSVALHVDGAPTNTIRENSVSSFEMIDGLEQDNMEFSKPSNNGGM